MLGPSHGTVHSRAPACPARQPDARAEMSASCDISTPGRIPTQPGNLRPPPELPESGGYDWEGALVRATPVQHLRSVAGTTSDLQACRATADGTRPQQAPSAGLPLDPLPQAQSAGQLALVSPHPQMPSPQTGLPCVQPLAGLHPSVVHGLPSSQFGAGPPWQVPAWQVSDVVQALPSLQLVPLPLGVATQAPVARLHAWVAQGRSGQETPAHRSVAAGGVNTRFCVNVYPLPLHAASAKM